MFYLKRNLPTWERLARLAAAIALAAGATMVMPANWPAWLAWASAAGIGATALFGFCPACALVGRRLDGTE
jgi:hypothetical protein